MRKGRRPVKRFLIMIPPKPEFDDTVHRILRRAEYGHLNNRLRDFLDSVKEAAGRWLLGLLDRLQFDRPRAPVISEGLSTVFMIAGLLLFLAVAVLLLVHAGRGLEKKARVREILGERIDERTTPGSLRKKAAAFLAEGDGRQAVRYDFIALLLLMHEKGLLYLDETKTNQEIYRYLDRNGFSMLRAFQELIGTFDSAWYGHRPCPRESYDAWNGRLGAVWNGVMAFEKKDK